MRPYMWPNLCLSSTTVLIDAVYTMMDIYAVLVVLIMCNTICCDIVFTQHVNDPRIPALHCTDCILLIALHIMHSAAKVRSNLRRAARLCITLHNVTVRVNVQNAQPCYAELCELCKLGISIAYLGIARQGMR